MKKKKKQIFIILFLILILSSLFFLIGRLIDKKDKRIYNISIITRGKINESLMIMKQGIDQAASEMNVNISFITLLGEDSVNEQKEVIEQEIRNKTDAIIISPVDYEKMNEPIENAMKKIPVILIESTGNTKCNIPSISCDNYKIGLNLAKEIFKNGDDGKKVAILKNNLECSSIKERYSGFTSYIENTKNKYIFWEISDLKNIAYYNKLKELLKYNDVDAVVAFDSGMLEILAQAKKDLSYSNKEKIHIEIYGTGSTNKIISFLDEKIINATAMQNEFNIGYLGVKAAVNMLDGKDIDNSVISSIVINDQDMYTNENQRLLFPFIR